MQTASTCGVVAIPTQLSNLRPESRRTSSKYEATKLDEGYQPHMFDVICGREKDNVFHFGNNRFRLFVDMHVDKYLAAKSRSDKTRVVKEVIDMVHASGGRFIRQVDLSEGDAMESSNLSPTGRQQGEAAIVFYDIGLKKTIDKTGHAIRRAASARRRIYHRRKSCPSPNSADSSLSGSKGMANMQRPSLTTFLSMNGSDIRMTGCTEEPRRAVNEAVINMYHPNCDHHRMVCGNMPVANEEYALRWDKLASQRQCSASEPLSLFAEFKLTSNKYLPDERAVPMSRDNEHGLSSSDGWDMEDFLDDTDFNEAAISLFN